MKAIKFYGVGDVRTVDTEAATPRNNQALIRVLYGGICGSDLHIYRFNLHICSIDLLYLKFAVLP